jgi:hypothetical protein
MEVYNQEVANPSDSNPLFLSSPSRPRRRKLLPPAVPLLLRAAIAEQCFLRCLALETLLGKLVFGSVALVRPR